MFYKTLTYKFVCFSESADQITRPIIFHRQPCVLKVIHRIHTIDTATTTFEGVGQVRCDVEDVTDIGFSEKFQRWGVYFVTQVQVWDDFDGS